MSNDSGRQAGANQTGESLGGGLGLRRRSLSSSEIAAFRSRFLAPVQRLPQRGLSLSRLDSEETHEADEGQPSFVNQARILSNFLD